MFARRFLGAALTALVLLVALAHPADARRVRHASDSPVPVAGAMVDDRYANLREPEAHATARAGQRHTAGQVIGGRPAGCPARFCGCGASLNIFGRIIPALNLAANWLRFPRAAPAPDMVAARPGHVFVLKAHIQGNTWLVFDANSGHHKTRIHPRSIAGFTIVNPRGGAVSFRAGADPAGVRLRAGLPAHRGMA